MVCGTSRLARRLLVGALTLGCGGGISGGDETVTAAPAEPTSPAAPPEAPPERSADERWVEVRVDDTRVEPSDGAPAADCESDEDPVEGRPTCIAFRVYGNEYNPDGVANTRVFVCSLDGDPAREVAMHGRGGRLEVGSLAAGAHTFRCEVQAPGGRPLDSNLENNVLQDTFEVRSPESYYVDLALARPAAPITTHHPGEARFGDENPGPYSSDPFDSFELDVRSEGPATPRHVNVICTTPDHAYPGFSGPNHPHEGVFAGALVRFGADGSATVRLRGPAVPEGQSLALECEVRTLVPEYLPDRNPANDRIALSITGGPATL